MNDWPKHEGPDIPGEYTDETYAAEQIATAQWLDFEAQYEGPAKARTSKGLSPLQSHESRNE